MKNKIKILVIAFFCIIAPNVTKAQVWSAETLYSPPSSSTSTLINGASRFGYHLGDWSTFYMRYNDSSYFCSVLNVAMWISVPNAYKIPLPQDFVIKDFKRFRYYQGFIGSYQGVGMLGRAMIYNSPTNNNQIRFFQFPAISCFNRVAIGIVSGVNIPTETQAFAIGERLNPGYPSQSFILEFYAENSPMFYRYAPLAYDMISGEQEIADDVILLGEKVVYATRDTRQGHAAVNLRIADTHNVLLNGDIDSQWPIYLPPYEVLIGNIRLLALNEKDFVLAYIVYNTENYKYFLCVNKIYLPEFLAQNNAIVTHEIPIDPLCLSLIDLVYEPVVNTMVALLNGNKRSVFYHVDPFATSTTPVCRLDYPNGELYSIDTLRDSYTSPIAMYVAMGDDKIFCQNISSGINVVASCLKYNMIDVPLVPSPGYRKTEDPIDRFLDNREYVPIDEDAHFFDGIKTCFISQDNKSIMY